MTSIASRASWGARHANGVGDRPVGSLEKYLHHTVTAHLPVTATVAQERAQMRVIESIGQQRFGRGISYSFIIFPSGRIYEGASVNRVSYHSGAGRNTRGVGICLAGNYEVGQMTPQQIQSVIWLLLRGVDRGWWRDPAITEGHRDFSQTACPGRNAYARIPEINRSARNSDIPGGTTPMSNVLHDTTFRAADAGQPWESPEESAARRIVRGVQRSGRNLHILRDLRDTLFDRVWRRDTLAARHEGREYGMGEQNAAERLTDAAEYARRSVVLGRRTEAKVDHLTALVVALADAQGGVSLDAVREVEAKLAAEREDA